MRQTTLVATLPRGNATIQRSAFLLTVTKITNVNVIDVQPPRQT
ncbi:MAG: hypothetical protein U9Q82_02925 [Chloroflexota bacterium]|nr:hypothetical protein [Chloroflexota bacterium]